MNQKKRLLKALVFVLTAMIFTQGACASTTLNRNESVELFMNGDYESLGDVNWALKGKTIEASAGNGFLVTKESYGNFHLQLEFYAAPGTNSGIFFRCDSSQEVTDKTCYEANIFDTRPDQTYRTGAITNFAVPKVNINTENGSWHSYEVIAVGDRLQIILDGNETVFLRDTQHRIGPIALQLAKGRIKFRNVSLKVLGDTQGHAETPIDGVWELAGFTLTDSKGNVSEWCKGSYGVIIYTEGYMSTAINCASDPSKVLLYSGPFKFENNTVSHSARNYSDPSLNKIFRRSVTMKDQNHLTLSGSLNDGGMATVNWVRR